MTANEGIERRAGARDAALRLLNRLTAASVVAGVAGLGLFGYAGAATYAGTAGTTASATTSTSSSSTTSQSGLQSSSGTVSSSSGAGIAVSGGS